MEWLKQVALAVLGVLLLAAAFTTGLVLLLVFAGAVALFAIFFSVRMYFLRRALERAAREITAGDPVDAGGEPHDMPHGSHRVTVDVIDGEYTRIDKP